jgi:hypothetical protein
MDMVVRVLLGRTTNPRKGLDTTVKSGKDLGRVFSPTWEMVLGYKNSQDQQANGVVRFPGYAPMSWERYSSLYREMLNNLPVDGKGIPYAVRDLYSFGKEQPNNVLLLRCYCPVATEFCHNQLLVSWLTERWPRAFGLLQESLPGI